MSILFVVVSTGREDASFWSDIFEFFYSSCGEICVVHYKKNNIGIIKCLHTNLSIYYLTYYSTTPVPVPTYSLLTTVRGTRVMFHSARVFISSSAGVLLICTASVICRIIESYLNDFVVDIVNRCCCPLCFSRQCRHIGDCSLFLAL